MRVVLGAEESLTEQIELLATWQVEAHPPRTHLWAPWGTCVLHVALERLLRQEVHKARRKSGVTVLMDMSTFYDTIQLNKLQEEAVKLDYPPLLLELAMQLYTGPKAILAEQEMTPFFHVDHGVPAGCPQAPLLAKVVLAPALIPWKQQHPQINLSSWVGDVGFDMEGSTPLQVAQQAVEAYRDLHSRLTALGLKVNPKKTAFIATDKATDHAQVDAHRTRATSLNSHERSGRRSSSSQKTQDPCATTEASKGHTTENQASILEVPSTQDMPPITQRRYPTGCIAGS